METLMDRIRNAFRRTADRITGHHVPLVTEPSRLEDLGDRRLQTPLVDVFENDREVLIVADTPGAFPDNSRLHWDERTGLSLHVRRADEADDRRLWGDDLGGGWYRAFTLPEYVDASEARARVHSGVLKIQIPKHATAAPVSIPVTAS